MAEKLAYRKLVRDPVDNQLKVAFVDATTGQVLTSTAGYTIVDQGVDFQAGTTPKPEQSTPPRKTRPPLTTHSDNNESSGDWIENKSGASRGPHVDLPNIGNPLQMVKDGISSFEDTKNSIKKSVQDWVVQSTGNDNLFPGELNKIPVTSSTNGVPDTGFTTNVPPKDAPPIPATKSNVLDDAMGAADGTSTNPDGTTRGIPNVAGTPASGEVKSPKLTDGEVARNIVYDYGDKTIRDLPVKSTVITDLAAVVNATDPTVTVKINSGGQVPLNSKDAVPGDNRTTDTTVNHDVDVNGASFASDQLYYRDGKRITPDSDPKFFQSLAKNAAIAGFSQIGMGGSTVHLGKDPRDTHLRTWGYKADGTRTSTPSYVLAGIKEARKEVIANPDAYTQMVAAVARPDPNAPIPASRGSQDALGGILPDAPSRAPGDARSYESFAPPTPKNDIGAKANDTDVPSPAVVAANSVRESLGLTPILDATQKALAGLSSSIPRYDINLPDGPPLTKDQLDQMSLLSLDNPFGGVVRGLANGQIKDGIKQAIAMGKQVIPAVASNVLGGAVDTLNNTITSARNGFMPENTPVNPMTPNAKLDVPADRNAKQYNDPSVTINPTPQSLAQASPNNMNGIPVAPPDISKGGFLASVSANGKPVSEPIPVAYTLDGNQARRDAVIRTVWGEARGESDQGVLAVANVIKNRVLADGRDPTEIVSKKDQFDGYKVGINATIPPAEYKRIADIVDRSFAGQLPDNTGKALHFHANWDNPYWTSSLVDNGAKSLVIGGQTFYSKGKVDKTNMTSDLNTGFIQSPPSGPPVSTMGGSAFTGNAAKTNYTPSNSTLDSFMSGPSTTVAKNSTGAKANDTERNSGYTADYSSTGPTSANTKSAKFSDSDSGGSGYTADYDSTGPGSVSSGSSGTGKAATGFLAGPSTPVAKTTTPTASQKATVKSGSSAVGAATSTKLSAQGTSANTKSAKFNE